MLYAKTFVTTSALAVLMAGASHAALTTEQVWSGWQENAALAGLNLVAETTAKEGSVMTLTNITVRAALSGGANDMVGSIAQIAMTEQPDGSVTIALSPEFSVPVNVDGSTGSVTITHQDFGLTARESAGGMAYDYTGTGLTIAADVDYMVDMIDGTGQKPASFDATYAFVNPRGTYSDTPGTNRAFRLTQISDALTYRVDQVDPTLGQSTEQSGEAQGIDLALDLTMPATRDLTSIKGPADFGAAVDDGLAVKMVLAQGAGTQRQTMQSDFFSFAADVSNGPGDVAMTFDRSGFDLVGSGGDLLAEVSSPQMPFPTLTVRLDGLAMAFKVPMRGDQMQAYRYMIKLENLTVNEAAWATLDPTAALPRDPMTLDIDVTGKAQLDLYAMMQADADGTTPPVPAIESLDIAVLNLAAAGALLTGAGAFTFDNTTGIPMPRGTADVTLTGGNALIDGLIAIGLLPPDQAQGARMAMAMFMEPGAGPDMLTSRIEARDDGGIYVNGQRMQ